MKSFQMTPKAKKYGYRLLSLIVSFIIGWIIYTIGVIVFPYDGVVAIVFQTVIGAMLTGIVVLVSWSIGFIAKKYIPAKYLPDYRFNLMVILVCLFFLIFGYSLGLRGQYIDSEMGATFQGINPVIGITSYLLIIFLIANWPIKQKHLSPMKLIFIRHGQTTGDVEDRFGGDYDDHLSPEGIKQSETLAEELRDKKIEVIISSPLMRAKESAQLASKGIYPNTLIQIEPDFKERNQYGILTGKIKSEAKQFHPDLVQKLKDRLNTIEGAESYEDFRDRIQAGFDRLIANSMANRKHTCVAVVWHGGPMRVLFRDILKKGEIEYGDCAWVELEKEGEEFVVKDSKRMEFLF